MRNWLDTGSHFRYLTLITLASIFALVVLGGVVRVTESGLGCPDWPLCHGKIIPDANAATLIEYSHRLVASLVGMLVLATAVVAWRRYRTRAWIFWPSLIGVVLIIVQSALGGATVLTELEGEFVMAHLALAEALTAVFILVALDAWKGVAFSTIRMDGVAILAAIAALAVYVLLITGSYTTVSGASGACNRWPLCQDGNLYVLAKLPIIHMVHRLAAVIAVIAAFAVVAWAWRSRVTRPDVALASLLALAVYALQVFAGALVVWWGLPVEMRALHLALATVVWMAFVVLALLPYTPVPKRT